MATKKSKLSYDEGSIFTVKLRGDSIVIGIVSRKSHGSPGIVLSYFFLAATTDPYHEACQVERSSAILYIRVGDSQLINGNWPIIGRLPNWNRRCWPVPDFCRRNPILGTTYRVRLSDDNIEEVESEEAAPCSSDIPSFGVAGHKYVEEVLQMLVEERGNKIL